MSATEKTINPYYDKLKQVVFSSDPAKSFQNVETDKACVFLKFDRSATDDTSPFILHNFMVKLYQASDVEILPLQMGMIEQGKLGILLECPHHNDCYGRDLRNTFPAVCSGILSRYGVTEVEFKNFPLPFKPEGIKFINAGNTPCP